MNCPPGGTGHSANSEGDGHDPGNHYLISQLDQNNPVVVCDPRVSYEDTYQIDGSTSDTIYFDGYTETVITGTSYSTTKYYTSGGSRIAMSKDGVLGYLVPDLLGSASLDRKGCLSILWTWITLLFLASCPFIHKCENDKVVNNNESERE